MLYCEQSEVSIFLKFTRVYDEGAYAEIRESSVVIFQTKNFSP